MKFKLLYLTVIFGFLISCKDDSQQREAEHLKANQKQDSIFYNINEAWQFSNKPFNTDTQLIIDNWNEWKNFQAELMQKPKSSISAFQQKVIAISSQTDRLNKNIPTVFDTPQIRSRITAIVTKIKALEGFIMLDNIPYEKVVALLSDINTEIGALQEQMQITTARTNIHFEEGEAEMLNALDASKTKIIAPQ